MHLISNGYPLNAEDSRLLFGNVIHDKSKCCKNKQQER